MSSPAVQVPSIDQGLERERGKVISSNIRSNSNNNRLGVQSRRQRQHQQQADSSIWNKIIENEKKLKRKDHEIQIVHQRLSSAYDLLHHVNKNKSHYRSKLKRTKIDCKNEIYNLFTQQSYLSPIGVY